MFFFSQTEGVVCRTFQVRLVRKEPAECRAARAVEEQLAVEDQLGLQDRSGRRDQQDEQEARAHLDPPDLKATQVCSMPLTVEFRTPP